MINYKDDDADEDEDATLHPVAHFQAPALPRTRQELIGFGVMLRRLCVRSVEPWRLPLSNCRCCLCLLTFCWSLVLHSPQVISNHPKGMLFQFFWLSCSCGNMWNLWGSPSEEGVARLRTMFFLQCWWVHPMYVGWSKWNRKRCGRVSLEHAWRIVAVPHLSCECSDHITFI